jgi:hypothetical protein
MLDRVNTEVDKPIVAKDIQVLQSKTVPFIEVEDL